jgi:hypothetical protein
MEIKFHLNETIIEWHYMQLEFNFNLIYFNPNLIEFEFNWIQIPKLNSNSSIEFENIEWNSNSMGIELKFNRIFDSTKFNSNSSGFKIQFKINKMQIGARRC